MNDAAKGPNESRRALVAPEKTRITLAVPAPVAAITSAFPSLFMSAAATVTPRV